MKASRVSLDRISCLPPTIIETILCLLPIQEAVRTSVLSKEWRYNWTKIPKLKFDAYKFKVAAKENQLSVMEQTFHKRSERKTMSDKCKFFYAIYQVLLLHQGPILEFTLSVLGADIGCVEIDQIITHLSRKDTVTKLTLDLNNSYRLPLSIFSLQQLTDLTLLYCEIDHQPPLNGFASLTRLCLMDVEFTNKTYLHLISSCPELKCFELHTEYSSMDNNDGEAATLPKLLECLHVVEQLTFSLCYRLSYAEFESVLPRELPTLLVHLKYICLEHISFCDKYWLCFLVLLMRSSPNLEKIEILTPEIGSISLEDFSDIWLEHLNEVVIGDFSYSTLNMELVKLLLSKSPLLKKLKIFLCNEISKDKELKICKILLRSTRASPLVDIIVERVSGRS